MQSPIPFEQRFTEEANALKMKLIPLENQDSSQAPWYRVRILISIFMSASLKETQEAYYSSLKKKLFDMKEQGLTQCQGDVWYTRALTFRDYCLKEACESMSPFYRTCLFETRGLITIPPLPATKPEHMNRAAFLKHLHDKGEEAFPCSEAFFLYGLSLLGRPIQRKGRKYHLQEIVALFLNETKETAKDTIRNSFDLRWLTCLAERENAWSIDVDNITTLTVKRNYKIDEQPLTKEETFKLNEAYLQFLNEISLPLEHVTRAKKGRGWSWFISEEVILTYLVPLLFMRSPLARILQDRLVYQDRLIQGAKVDLLMNLMTSISHQKKEIEDELNHLVQELDASQVDPETSKRLMHEFYTHLCLRASVQTSGSLSGHGIIYFNTSLVPNEARRMTLEAFRKAYPYLLSFEPSTTEEGMKSLSIKMGSGTDEERRFSYHNAEGILVFQNDSIPHGLLFKHEQGWRLSLKQEEVQSRKEFCDLGALWKEEPQLTYEQMWLKAMEMFILPSLRRLYDIVHRYKLILEETYTLHDFMRNLFILNEKDEPIRQEFNHYLLGKIRDHPPSVVPHEVLITARKTFQARLLRQEGKEVHPLLNDVDAQIWTLRDQQRELHMKLPDCTPETQASLIQVIEMKERHIQTYMKQKEMYYPSAPKKKGLRKGPRTPRDI